MFKIRDLLLIFRYVIYIICIEIVFIIRDVNSGYWLTFEYVLLALAIYFLSLKLFDEGKDRIFIGIFITISVLFIRYDITQLAKFFADRFIGSLLSASIAGTLSLADSSSVLRELYKLLVTMNLGMIAVSGVILIKNVREISSTLFVYLFSLLFFGLSIANGMINMVQHYCDGSFQSLGTSLVYFMSGVMFLVMSSIVFISEKR